MNTMHLMIAILGTGISLAGLIIGLIIWLRADMKDLRSDMKGIEVRLSAVEHSQAKLEGLMQGLRAAIVARSTS